MIQHSAHPPSPTYFQYDTYGIARDLRHQDRQISKNCTYLSTYLPLFLLYRVSLRSTTDRGSRGKGTATRRSNAWKFSISDRKRERERGGDGALSHSLPRLFYFYFSAFACSFYRKRPPRSSAWLISHLWPPCFLDLETKEKGNCYLSSWGRGKMFVRFVDGNLERNEHP